MPDTRIIKITKCAHCPNCSSSQPSDAFSGSPLPAWYCDAAQGKRTDRDTIPAWCPLERQEPAERSKPLPSIEEMIGIYKKVSNG